jgi:hypothetical protein
MYLGARDDMRAAWCRAMSRDLDLKKRVKRLRHD